ncbi:hypothetical protein DL98DRAFT_259506 [Cadophora sp. DSE1049]|nr:hypothetical protein DL98DRAFT_259506 [Cadophora sp. DSE1049]
MGCVSNREVPICLLSVGDSDRKSILAVTAALEYLESCSLITAVPKRQSFQMHSVVYLAVRDWLRSKKLFLHWTRVATQALRKVLPSNLDTALGSLPLCEMYLPHVEAVLADGGLTSEDNHLRHSLERSFTQYSQVRIRTSQARRFSVHDAVTRTSNVVESCNEPGADRITGKSDGGLLKVPKPDRVGQQVVADKPKKIEGNHENTSSSHHTFPLSRQISEVYPLIEKTQHLVSKQEEVDAKR